MRWWKLFRNKTELPRVQQRRAEEVDPSEADEEVLMGQWTALEPLTAAETARAVGGVGLEDTEERLRSRLPDLFSP